MSANLPALRVNQQIPFLAKMCEQPLYNGNGRRNDLVDNWEEIDSENAERKSLALSLIFGGRDVSAGLGSEFWVYCKNLEDVATVTAQLNTYGYTNLETFVPKVGHPDDDKKSIADPNPLHAYAINVSNRQSLIFGDHAAGWLKLHQPLIDVVSEFITYTYCHNTDARFTFQRKEPAAIFYAALLQHYAMIEREAVKLGKQAPKMKIELKKHFLCMNSYQVFVDFDRDAF